MQTAMVASDADSRQGGPRPKRRGWAAILRLGVFAAAVTLALWPALIGPYLYYDDYQYVFKPNSDSSLGWTQGISQGRPLSGLMWSAIPRLVQRVEDGWRLRVVFAAGLVATALAIDGWLRRCGLSAFHAGAASVLIVTLPGCTAMASWLLCALFSWSMWLAALAAGVAGRVILRPAGPPVALGRATLRLAVVAALLLVALLIYQPTAMLYWPLMIGGIIAAERTGVARVHWRGLLLAAFSGMAAVGLYWLVTRGLFQWTGVWQDPRGSLETDPVAKAAWLIGEVLPLALNLWNLLPTAGVTWGVAGVVASGFIIGWATRVRRRERWPAALRTEAALLLTACAGPLLSFLPNLLANHRWAAYRMLVPMMALVVLLLLETLRATLSLLPRRIAVPATASVMLVIAVLSVRTAREALNVFVARPQRAELAFIRRELAASSSAAERILVVASGYKYSPTKIVRFDEFGWPSSSWTWNGRELVRAAASQLGWDWRSLEIDAVEADAAPESVPIGTLLLDLRRLTELRHPTRPPPALAENALGD